MLRKSFKGGTRFRESLGRVFNFRFGWGQRMEVWWVRNGEGREGV